MTLKIWTAYEDEMIFLMRLYAVSWGDIGKFLGCAHQTIIYRAELLYGKDFVRVHMRTAPAPKHEPLRTARPDGYPLPPGHPVTWGAITRGTCLEGSAYPTRPTV